MIQENEVLTLLLGAGVLIFILINGQALKRLPSWKTLISAFYMLLAGWVLTILEGFFWGSFLNIVEHACYSASAVLVAVWCWKVHGSRKEARK
ncbi:hypothetical protein J7M28_14420 [bacterium]|nr:hypothetical protein [bacterium]